MPATLSVALKDPGFLLAINGVDILVDGNKVDEVDFGQTKAVAVEPGAVRVMLRLRAVARRRSRTLTLQAVEGETLSLVGVYSRLWGTVKLSEA